MRGVDCALKEFNLGENFKGWIKMLFNGAKNMYQKKWVCLEIFPYISLL
jgi:hypothetical protein